MGSDSTLSTLRQWERLHLSLEHMWFAMPFLPLYGAYVASCMYLPAIVV